MQGAEMARQSTCCGARDGATIDTCGSGSGQVSRTASCSGCGLWEGVAPAFRFRLDPKCRSINGRGLTGLVVVGGV